MLVTTLETPQHHILHKLNVQQHCCLNHISETPTAKWNSVSIHPSTTLCSLVKKVQLPLPFALAKQLLNINDKVNVHIFGITEK
jgi:hypothetical protein